MSHHSNWRNLSRILHKKHFQIWDFATPLKSHRKRNAEKSVVSITAPAFHRNLVDVISAGEASTSVQNQPTGYHRAAHSRGNPEHLLLSFYSPPPTNLTESKALCNTLHPLQQNSLEYFLANFRSSAKAEVIVSCHNFNVFFLLLVCTVLAGNAFS